MTEQAAAHHPDFVDPAADDDEDALTMNQRIQAFYLQSGGPGVPEIGKFLDHHLRYGTDHGVPGHMETIEDVFSQVVRGDKSLYTLFQRYNRWKADREEKEDQKPDALTELGEKVSQLEGEITGLRQLLTDVLRGGEVSASPSKADER